MNETHIGNTLDQLAISDFHLNKLVLLAQTTLKKARILLHHAAGPDHVDLMHHMTIVQNAIINQDMELLENALNELTDMVYYLELSPRSDLIDSFSE